MIKIKFEGAIDFKNGDGTIVVIAQNDKLVSKRVYMEFQIP